MAKRRISLRDRDTAAFEAPHDEADAVATPDPAAPTPARPAPRATPARTRAPKPKPTPAAATARIGIYLHPEEYDAAKAGYLADWKAGGDHDTLGKWVTGCLATHAARTPAERLALARNLGRRDTAGGSRTFHVEATVLADVRAAIATDQDHDHWTTESAWAGDAIAAAVNHARQRAGGTLPEPPARLPNRLIRR